MYDGTGVVRQDAWFDVFKLYLNKAQYPNLYIYEIYFGFEGNLPDFNPHIYVRRLSTNGWSAVKEVSLIQKELGGLLYLNKYLEITQEWKTIDSLTGNWITLILKWPEYSGRIELAYGLNMLPNDNIAYFYIRRASIGGNEQWNKVVQMEIYKKEDPSPPFIVQLQKHKEFRCQYQIAKNTRSQDG